MKTGIYWQDPKYTLRPGRDFIFDPSLVLYLPFGKLDGASFMSKDKHGHLCTVTGALWQLNGRLFDGSDDKVNCGNAVAFDITDTITQECWFKSSDTSQQQNVIFKDQAGSGGNFALKVRQTSGVVDATYNDSIRATSTAGVADGAWHHLVSTYDKDAGGTDEVKIYIDGSPDGIGNYSTALVTNTYPLYLGWGYLNDYGVIGLIGEVRVYNRVLTPLEIQGNYLATKRRYQ